MRAGGTAADGAIAGMLCSGIVNPHSMGIGGGFLLTYYSRSEGKAYALNARESAPAAATRDMFQGNQRLAVKGELKFILVANAVAYPDFFEVGWGWGGSHDPKGRGAFQTYMSVH